MGRNIVVTKQDRVFLPFDYFHKHPQMLKRWERGTVEELVYFLEPTAAGATDGMKVYLVGLPNVHLFFPKHDYPDLELKNIDMLGVSNTEENRLRVINQLETMAKSEKPSALGVPRTGNFATMFGHFKIKFCVERKNPSDA